MISKKKVGQCTKLPLCVVWGRARPQGSIVPNLILHFHKKLFPHLKTVTFRSHGSSFTSCAKAPVLTNGITVFQFALVRLG
uniref:Uncharacterized protein n=1 Tax=Solanum tuberosum TaxID=4113 RepID=M1AZ32_SOLTU